MPNSSNILQVQKISHQYDPPHGPLVLKEVSFEVSPSQQIAIIGPSGSGKSTLLNIIGSLDKPTSGSVRLGDRQVNDLNGTALADYRATCVGFVFQDHHLLPQLTTMENVLLPSLASGNTCDATSNAMELLASMGLEARTDAYPAKLSGGERQRIAIARAMINRPTLLLCDEPTGNLDRKNAELIVRLLQDLSRQRQVIVLMVTHNQQLAGMCDRILELRDGQLQPMGESA